MSDNIVFSQPTRLPLYTIEKSPHAAWKGQSHPNLKAWRIVKDGWEVIHGEGYTLSLHQVERYITKCEEIARTGDTAISGRVRVPA